MGLANIFQVGGMCIFVLGISGVFLSQVPDLTTSSVGMVAMGIVFFVIGTLSKNSTKLPPAVSKN